MKNFFRLKNSGLPGKQKAVVLLFLLFIVFGSVFIPVRQAHAQMLVADIPKLVWDKVGKVITTVLQKAGSIAFQRTLSTALNKIAYDSANYLGSGGKGQKPLFITKDLGSYLEQIGDEAAGQFVENFINNLTTSSGTDCASKYDSCTSQCSNTEAASSVDPANYTACLDQCDEANTSCVANPAWSGTRNNENLSPSFNVCQPSSLAIKLRIGLGLVDQTRPQGPNCTFSEMVQNWGDDINKKMADLRDENYLDEFVNVFDPRSNDVGIHFLAQADLANTENQTKTVGNSYYMTGKGWTDVRDIAGELSGTPGEAQRAKDEATAIRQANFGKTTGDILIDSANIFLNQLYISSFDNLLRNLAKKTTDPNKTYSLSALKTSIKTGDFTGGTTESTTTGNNSGTGSENTGSENGSIVGNFESDPNIAYGEATVKEITSTLIKPKFGVRADYDILAELSICSDPANPGPDNCVIDSSFMQGISEKKTVAEALKDGYLNSDWKLTDDKRGDSYTNSYSLRNLSILRKYRILPIGWEIAVEKAYADPDNPKKVTLMDMVSCFDLSDEYNQFSSDFNTRDQGWCQGLIDPNWVLKAPLNYCKKQGVGGQLLSKTVTPGIKGQAGVADTLSELNIVRADGYCADEQTCLKENKNGSCEVYGYCDEEKRTWNFNADSCRPIYNTCQAFVNTTSGQAVSYLENTLNYGDCSPENAGCRRYSLSGAYATSTGTVAWDENKILYLNKNLSSCNSKDEGCSELIRVKPTWGGNLIMDSDFANEEVGASTTGASLGDWLLTGNIRTTVVNAALEPGGASGKAMKLEVSSGGGLVSSTGQPFVPANFQVIPGQAYTLSVDVYLTAGDSVSLFIGAAGDGFVKTTATKNGWQHLNITRPSATSYNAPGFGLVGSGSGQVTFYLKNLKLEMSGWDTGYASYGSFKIREKILPPYLENTCYQDAISASKDYRLKENAPAICSNYARKCNKEEVGCELFKNTKDSFTVPAKVTDNDYCPTECLGYDVYISKEGYFNSAASENMIPAKAVTCNADAAGCSEFTNLDTLAAGGEQREYYTSLKQCIKPSPTACASFYSWEGTGNGYQLKVYNLKKNTVGTPEVTSDDSSLCNARIYNLPVGDPEFNADCREFYNAAGDVAYHLTARTITCSDNCHAYRMSEKNIDKSLVQTACVGADKHWEGNNCYTCRNGGIWDAIQNACVYQAIPGEGKTCQATANGCREYNGNGGSNVRLAASYDFEKGLGGWSSNCAGGISVSNISNNKNGHSLQYDNNIACANSIGTDAGAPIAKKRLLEQILAGDSLAAQVKVGGLVKQGSAYTVKFLANAAANTNLKIYFLNTETNEKTYFSGGNLTIKGGGEWQVYQANLDNLNHKVGAKEILVISADNSFFLDNFVLSEITERYYLIKNSSRIPDICYYDIADNYQGADYNLGCAQYSDRGNLKHNLHKFTTLCSNSSVGCEQMIDTKNYAPTGAGVWNDTNNNGVCDGDEADCVKVAGDSALYAVYDTTKQCNATDLGCSRLGQASGQGTVWSDVFRKNNPNLYDNILCESTSVGCEEWRNADDSGLNYFRNPGNDICIYRESNDPANPGEAWYRIPVMRCDLNNNTNIDGAEKTGALCSTNADCGGQNCLVDNNDYPCSFSYLKTIGFGGAGGQVPTPNKEAGLCDANASGCTEYIDPVSKFSPNVVYNANFQLISGSREGWGNTTSEKWNGQTPAADQQVIYLKLNKLYSLTTKSAGGAIGAATLTFSSEVNRLGNNNTFGAAVTQLALAAGANQPIIFNSRNNSRALLSGGAEGKIIEIKELITDYQLRTEVDKKSCNGSVKFDNGCVLFNERLATGVSGSDLSSSWNAYASFDNQAPAACVSGDEGSCTANQLIKVQPDRTCAKWLDCVTYSYNPTTKQKTCYAVGECDQLNDKNECANSATISSSQSNSSGLNLENNKNLSGYTLINRYDLGAMREVGINTDAHFDFETADISLNCRQPDGQDCNFEKNLNAEVLVLEPEGSPTDYPAQGKGFLKVPGNYQISPLASGASVRITPQQDYYINYLVSTKGSGGQAEVIITDADDDNSTTLFSFTDEAPNGWERRVHKFNISGSGVRYINIFLTSLRGSEKNIYFDDINIEPVLKIGNSYNEDGTENESRNYVAKDCRLYPEDSSLSCASYNNNVIQDGLYGYCLQYDPLNPRVCALWYPIDQISSISSGQTNLGYKGKAPLYYCTEVNGNFQLAEKIKTVKIFDSGVLPSEALPGVSSCSRLTAQCPTYCGNCANYEAIKTVERTGSTGNYRYDTRLYCVPKVGDRIKLAGSVGNLSDFGDKSGCSLPFSSEAWMPYDGTLTKQDIAAGANCPADYPCSGIDEANNFSPPVAVFEKGMSKEDQLKFITSPDPEKIARVRCNRFAQLVDGQGNNKAWTDRVSRNSLFPTTTPAFFGSNVGGVSYEDRIFRYGRNREDVPFGAAVFPSNFQLSDQSEIYLRNQYSNKNNETTLAGRPYGCSFNSDGTNQVDSGCYNIGQCSLNPNVFCIYHSATTAYDINKESCAAGGFGVCTPLWGTSNNDPLYTYEKQPINNIDSRNILKTLFYNRYAQYEYSGSTYQIPVVSSPGFKWESIDTAPGLCGGVGAYRGDSNAFCAVKPQLGNIKRNGLPVPASGQIAVSASGVYTLTFNTKIDKEQQPLKQIIINWGDGDIQLITGEDGRPLASEPHTFYHYYVKKATGYSISISIVDNWDQGCHSGEAGVGGNPGCYY
ncbi:MAG: hypothetical protein WC458_01115 [Patescibacteria group bacterium]